MASVRQLFSQTAVYGLGTILPRFLNYLLTPLYTYLFTNPADYGINAEMYAYISFLNILFTYGMETTFFHFANKSEHPQKIFNVLYTLMVFTTILFSLILVAFTESITKLLHYSNTLTIYWTIGILSSDALLALPYAYLRQHNKAFNFSLLKILNVMFNIGFNLFFFLLCKKHFDNHYSTLWAKIYNPEIGISYAFLSNLLANGLNMLLLLPVLKKFCFEWDTALLRPMLVYALPLVVVGLAGMINETFDRIVLKYLLPPDVAQSAQGIYGACYKLSILLTIFIQAYRYAAEPFFFRIFKDNDSKEMYAKTTDVFVAFGLILWLGTILNLPILQYFIGPSYRVGLKVVPVLLTANLCLGIYFNLSFWYKLTGQTQIGAYITLLGAILTLLINFIFVPKYSYVASAWATLAAYASMMLLSYFLGQKYFKVNYFMDRILINCISALAIFLLVKNISLSNLMLQIVVNNVFLLLFVLFLIMRYSKFYSFTFIKKN